MSHMVRVLKVDQPRVFIETLGIEFEFLRLQNGQIKLVSRKNYNGGRTTLPKGLFDETFRTAAAILRGQPQEKEARDVPKTA